MTKHRYSQATLRLVGWFADALDGMRQGRYFCTELHDWYEINPDGTPTVVLAGSVELAYLTAQGYGSCTWDAPTPLDGWQCDARGWPLHPVVITPAGRRLLKDLRRVCVANPAV